MILQLPQNTPDKVTSDYDHSLPVRSQNMMTTEADISQNPPQIQKDSTFVWETLHAQINTLSQKYYMF